MTTRLNWEIESYSPFSGELVAWVKVPTLSHSANTVIYMGYGDLSNTSFEGGSLGSAWDSNYALVQHYNEVSSDLSLADSTANSTFFTNGGLSLTDGKIGKGYANDGTQYATFDYAPIFDLSSGDWTMSAWFNSTSFADYQAIFSKDTYGSNFDWAMLISDSGTISLWTAGTSQTHDFIVPTMSTNTWYYFTLTGTSDGTFTLYINGVNVGATASGAMTMSNWDTISGSIGALSYSHPNSFFNGSVDELRLSNGAARSSDWTLSEYNNQSNPGNVGSPGFYTVGDEQ